MKNEYIKQYELLHLQKPNYGMTSIQFYDYLVKIIKKYNVKSILDYGCGKSKLLDNIKEQQKIDIYKYDPAISEFSILPIKDIDFIICTDVLQHIPLYDLDRVLNEIKSYKCDCFFHIRCTAYHTVLPNGQLANCTVYPSEWWKKKLEDYFNNVKVVNENDLDTVSFITEDYL